MLKMISVNMEGEKHFPRILNLIANEQPDVICIQECTEEFLAKLQTLGYQTSFCAMRRQIQNDVAYVEGNAIATKLPHVAVIKYYYQPDRTLPITVPTPNDLKHHNVIIAQVTDNLGDSYIFATTHGIYTKNGLPDEHQTQGVKKLLSLLAAEKQHILCGDFNIPRGVNELYGELTKAYSDTVPAEYMSSLDRTYHIHGTNPNLTEPIFDSYMVDYIFSKPEYTVTDVRLQFGVSDHAAIIATVGKTHLEPK
jgi:endonuclease/exonuclease/phosphatase family metal-dependent hydrolase